MQTSEKERMAGMVKYFRLGRYCPCKEGQNNLLGVEYIWHLPTNKPLVHSDKNMNKHVSFLICNY